MATNDKAERTTSRHELAIAVIRGKIAMLEGVTMPEGDRSVEELRASLNVLLLDAAKKGAL